MSESTPVDPQQCPVANSLVFDDGDGERLMFYPSPSGGLTVRLEWSPDGILRSHFASLRPNSLEQLEAFIRQVRQTAKPNHKYAKCSFCGKHHEAVKKLISGGGSFICDECVSLCTTIINNPDECEQRPS